MASEFFNKTLHGLIPSPGNHTLAAEIQCYSLPYGAIGFVGHLLTYWTVASLIIGRQPWRIWKNKPVQKRRWNLLIDCISLIISVGFATLALVKCLGSWQFVLLAIWKMTLAISLSGMALHRTLDLHKDRKKHQLKLAPKDSSMTLQTLNSTNYGYQPVQGEYGEGVALNGNGIVKEDLDQPVPKMTLFFWFPLYLMGTIIGLIGLFSIVHERWSDIRLEKITCVFLGLAFGPVALYLSLAVFVGSLGKRLTGEGTYLLILRHGTMILLIFSGWVGIIAALYSDWALGAIMDNLPGAPSTSNWVIYAAYFIAKRLPMLSI